MPSKQVTNAAGRPKPPNAGKGRVKGTPNKTTALLKDALLQAATNAGGREGMVGYLTRQADENPGPFMALLGKVLPIQHSADPEAGVFMPVMIALVSPGNDDEDG